MALQLFPIVAALRRNRASAVLVVLQVTLMLTFIANLASVALERAGVASRPTGTAEDELFAIGFRLTGQKQSIPELQADLARVRDTPGVIDAIATNSYPLRGSGWFEGISRVAGPTSIRQQNAQTAVYAMDDHAMGTLGLKLVEGRNFSPDELTEGHYNAGPLPNVAIMTRSLARQVFGVRSALGQHIYVTSDSGRAITIIGVVDRLQSPNAAISIDPSGAENSLLLPIVAAGGGGLFIVRTTPKNLSGVMNAVRDQMMRTNPDRILGRLRPFTEIRSSAYQKDRALAIAFGILFAVLVLITGLSIVGLTSFWVLRRTLQVGIRRALGATRASIIRYFLLENALLCCVGVALGMCASVAMNLYLRTHYATDRVSALALIACAFMVVSIGQVAALVPVVRASRIDPSKAFRAA